MGELRAHARVVLENLVLKMDTVLQLYEADVKIIESLGRTSDKPVPPRLGGTLEDVPVHAMGGGSHELLTFGVADENT